MSAGPALNEEKLSKSDVLRHLDEMLHSKLFATAPRQRQLLQYLVEKHFDGAASELKEYTIGLEVFGKGVQFDPRLDPIVRVEANRLRARIQRYYGGTGHSIRISLPKGAYVPEFQYARRPLSEEPPKHGSRVEWRRPILLAMTALCALSGFILWARSRRAEAHSPEFFHFNRITIQEESCDWPTFSPDGKFLVYACRERGHWNLYRRRLGTRAARSLLPEADSNNYQPAYAPVGNRVAFRSNRDGGGIFLLQPDSGALSRLTPFGFYPSWSPDGSKIVFSSESFLDPAETESVRPSSLHIVNVRSRVVRPLPTPTGDALQPAWSPNGTMIAYWGIAPGGRRNIWIIPARSSPSAPGKAIRVTNDTSTDWDPAWSPDGRYLYFSSDRGGSMNLWRVRIDESSGAVLSSPEPVITPSSYSGWSAFARGGKRLAYVRRRVSSRLYRVPFRVGGEVQVDKETALTEGGQRVREPDMSPDGRWIVARMEDPQEDLVLLRPDGSSLHRLTNDSFSDRLPRWSPDGKKIIFLSNRSGRFDLWSIHPDGSGLRQITKGGSMPDCWAPDGTLIGYPDHGKPVALDPPGRAASSWGLPAGFVPLAWSPGDGAVVGRIPSDGLGHRALYIYTPGKRGFWKIAYNAAFPSTVWLHDGFHLLFSQREGIYVANLRQHSIHFITPFPAGNMCYRFTISRDEHTLFFVLSDDREDIWMGQQKN